MFSSTGKALSKNVLKEKIEGFLLTQPVCVVATSLNDVPRASAVEFFPEGLHIYILTEGGIKLRNIRKNAQVSLEIFAPYTGWANVQGLQISGIAELAKKGSKIFKEAEQAYSRRRGQEEAILPDFINVVKITPYRMEYLDMRLDRRGYSVRQVLNLGHEAQKKERKTAKKKTLKKTVKKAGNRK